MTESNATPGANAVSSSNDAVLQISGVSKSFGALIANDNISLSLCRGEIVALLGENGAGKTTLMNILFGQYRADCGSIRVFGRELRNHSPNDALTRGIGMVHQHFTLADNLTVLDNILLGTESLWLPFSRRKHARRKLQGIMDDAGLVVAMDSYVRDLTVGEKQRVEILKALFRDVRILILDEPTAVLTPQEVDDLFVLLRRMAGQGLAIILISHKLHEVLAISDRVVVLRQGQLVATTNTREVNREQLAELIVGHQVERPQAADSKKGDVLLSLTNVSILDNATEKHLLRNINLVLHANQITGLAGVSGNGQSILADVMSGLRKPDQGEFTIKGQRQQGVTPSALTRQGLARIPEDRHALGVVSEMTLWENLLLDELGESPAWRLNWLLDRRAARDAANTLIKQFDIRCSSAEQPAGLLSGGNMQKLILARNLARAPAVILANQPTRGLDEGAIAAVHTLLIEARDAGSSILLITEDLDELLRLSDEVVVMYNGQLSKPVQASGLSPRELGLRMSGAL